MLSLDKSKVGASMGIVDRINERMGVGKSYRDTRFARRNERELSIGLGFNIRDLGGYHAEGGRHVQYRRFLRSGDTSFLDREGVYVLRGIGVQRVLDLRGKLERPELSDVFARETGVVWKNVALFDHDAEVTPIEPAYPTTNEAAHRYLSLLADKDNVAEAITFLAETNPGACALYHCAAGLDRTGMVSLLLLGSVGVRRREIVCDYGYSFGKTADIDHVVATWDGTLHEGDDPELFRRLDAVMCVYDTILQRFGSPAEYLLDCGVDQKTLKRLRSHLLDERG